MQTSKNLNSSVKQRWSLRKLSVGVASVLLGLTFFGGQQVASANSGTPSQTISQPNVTAPSPTATSSASSTISTETRAYDAQSPVVPSGYATALQGFRPGPAGQTQTETSALMHVSQEGKAANTNNPNQSVSLVGINTATNGTTTVTFNVKYNSNSRDENMVVDPLHLTTAQQANLTNFAAQTINQIRQQVQAQPNGSTVSVGYLKVSPYATQVGNNIVTSAYKNFPAGGHNMTGLVAAARSEGINAWVGENIGSVGSGLMVLQIQKQGLLRNITMNDLKQEIYTDIIQMMYQDNNNNLGAGGHTTAQLNDPYYNVNSIQGGNAIALDRDGHLIPGANQYLALTIDNKGQVHFNFISDVDATDAAKHALAQNAVTPLGFVTETTSGSSATSATSSAASSASSAVSSAASSAHSSAASSASSATSSAATSAHSSAASSASSAESSAASSAHSSAASSASSAESSAATSAHSSAASSASSAVSSAASSAHSSAASSASSAESSAASSAHSSAASSASSAVSSAASSAHSSAASSASSAESSAASSAHSSAASSASSDVSSAVSNAHSSAASSASSAVSSAASNAHSSASSSASSATSSAASKAHSSAASSASSATSSAASSVTSSVDSNAASSMSSASSDNSSSTSVSNLPINTSSASANYESLSGNQASASSNGQVSYSAVSANLNSAASEVVDSTAASQVNTISNAQRSILTVSTSTSATGKALNLSDDNRNVSENNVVPSASKNATVKSDTQNNQLPQTGNNTKTLSLIGLVAAAATIAMGIFNFNKKRDY